MKPTLAETDAALEGSIRKWEKIVDGTGEDRRGDNCPLCQLFIDETGSCGSCPVYVVTGEEDCSRTPYVAWNNQFSGPYNRRATTPHLVELARAELEFLKSLRKLGKAKA